MLGRADLNLNLPVGVSLTPEEAESECSGGCGGVRAPQVSVPQTGYRVKIKSEHGGRGELNIR